jgi:hypothetical protein
MEVYPLVIDKTTGQIREVRSTETINTFAREINFRNLINADIDTIKKCAPVYLSASDSVALANAAAPLSSRVRGLAMKSAGAGLPVQVLASGFLEATLTEWDDALGVDILDPAYVPTGLVFNQDYYLSLSSGKITATPPSGSGQHIVYLGTADSPTTLEIDIDRPIAIT